MTLTKFAQKVAEAMGQVLNRNFVIKEQYKNNDVIRVGVFCSDTPTGKPSYVLYLERAFEDFNNGMPFGEIVAQCAKVYDERNVASSDFGVGWFSQWENIKNRLAIQMVNLKMNKKRFAKDRIVYRVKDDMAIIFVVVVNKGPNGIAASCVTEDHIQMWGVTEEDVEKAAMEGTFKIFPPTIQSMLDIMKELDPTFAMLPEEVLAEVATPMWIVSNSDHYYGASACFNKEVLRNVSEKIKGDMYVIPVSVHEVICVPAGDASQENLNEMIRQVNGDKNCISPEEVLSDHAYLYSAKEERMISLV